MVALAQIPLLVGIRACGDVLAEFQRFVIQFALEIGVALKIFIAAQIRAFRVTLPETLRQLRDRLELFKVKIGVCQRKTDFIGNRLFRVAREKFSQHGDSAAQQFLPRRFRGKRRVPARFGFAIQQLRQAVKRAFRHRQIGIFQQRGARVLDRRQELPLRFERPAHLHVFQERGFGGGAQHLRFALKLLDSGIRLRDAQNIGETQHEVGVFFLQHLEKTHDVAAVALRDGNVHQHFRRVAVRLGLQPVRLEKLRQQWPRLCQAFVVEQRFAVVIEFVRRLFISLGNGLSARQDGDVIRRAVIEALRRVREQNFRRQDSERARHVAVQVIRHRAVARVLQIQRQLAVADFIIGDIPLNRLL